MSMRGNTIIWQSIKCSNRMLTICMKSIDGYWSSWGNWINSKSASIEERNRICKNSIAPISYRLLYQSSEQIRNSENIYAISIILSISICSCFGLMYFLLQWFYNYLKDQQFQYEFIQDRLHKKISNLRWRRKNSAMLEYWNSLPTDDELSYSSIDERQENTLE